MKSRLPEIQYCDILGIEQGMCGDEGGRGKMVCVCVCVFTTFTGKVFMNNESH